MNPGCGKSKNTRMERTHVIAQRRCIWMREVTCKHLFKEVELDMLT